MNCRPALATFLLVFNCLWAGSSARAQTPSGTNTPTPGDYVCVQRGPHSRVWQRGVLQTNQSGVVRTNRQSYTELATGLCHLQDGQFIDSVEQIDAVADGAQATQGRHQVHWVANANTLSLSVQYCQKANVCGNTLFSGGYGFGFALTNGSALILNNNFSGATYRGIGYGSAGDSLNAAQIFGNILGEGVSFHVQIPYTNSFGWFLGTNNTYLNAFSNSVPPFLDPASSAVHISN